MKVYVVVSRETDAIVLRRVFATREAAERAMFRFVTWVATRADIQELFTVAEIEVEA